ncbi:MAG: TrbG/VirB9 family P-type conjugative transfer protein [Magnetospirillum sp.]|nr:TrbG/VirB9 family P-type conjugative transfer protein [Magnetospirillum sp.]
MIPLFMGALFALGVVVVPAEAQTPFGGKGQPVAPTPPPKTTQPTQQPTPQQSQVQQAQPTARVPMSPDMAKQAEFQAEGVFPEMSRPGAGGQVQDAWNDAEPRAGVYVQKLCDDCVYKVRTREFMTTTVILPEDAVITSADPGDAVGFSVKIKAVNKLAIRPASWGQDTNVNVYTKSGAVYPLYIRSETVNSMNVPDLVVKIVGREKPAPVEVVAPAGAVIDDKEKDASPDAPAMKPADGKKKGVIRHVPMDVSKFHGWEDYELSGDSELKPETIWRDDFFTYVRYGRKWDGMELSTGYVTVDGIDELVNSHVEGTTFVIESVAPLITLKNGKRFLCIRYTGAHS